MRESAFALPCLVFALAIMAGVEHTKILVPFLLCQFIGAGAEGYVIWHRFHPHE